MLDLQTLSLSTVIASSIHALFFILVWRLNREFSGINYWLVGMLLQPIGWALLAARGYITPWISIFGSIIIIISMLSYLLGAYRFFKREQPRYLPTIYLALFLPIFIYYTFVDESITARIIIVYSIGAAIMLQCVSIPFLIDKTQRIFGGYVFSLISGVIFLLIFIRLIATVWFPAIDKLYDFSVSNLIGVLIGFLMCYGMGFTFTILCNERRIRDIVQLKESAKLDAQLKNNYLAVLSHELRTPLNAIVGTAQLMQTKIISDELKHDCDIIIDVGKALSDISLEALSYASFNDIKSQAVQLDWVELPHWLATIVKLLNPLAENRGLTLRLVVKKLPKSVKLNTKTIRQVLINLIGNAIKYTNDGGIILVVNFTEIETQSPTLKGEFVFEVIDTGIGIPKTEQAQLLKRFTQGKNKGAKQTTISSGGVGLGLSIANKLLKACNSELAFTSEKNKGSCFRFSLQLECSTDESLSFIEQAAALTGLNILVIEDVALNQRVILSMLTLDKHQVDLAETGIVALEKLSRSPYDVILLDMQLPDLHGLTIYQALRNDKQNVNHHTAIIGLTATITPQDKVKYQQTDLISIVGKPIMLDKLRAAIIDSQRKSSKKKALQLDNNSAMVGNDELTEYPLFNPKPLTFIKENLESNDLIRAINELPKQLDEYNAIIQLAYQQQDLALVSQTAHQLAGYSAQMGLVRLAKYAEDIGLQLADGKDICLVQLPKLCQRSSNEIIQMNSSL
ncbi:ATP-binding protein [Colwellia ponticola]|uniref:histidine kinase n=1 Tax=Colwellia ponticola TaxID=2304625 RepID=A0A8H2PMR6_9GAMM|nr:ATP-binding protein [Colwellia ponticola]TMM45438.1 response regulator [Colwellia ponticola]